MDRFDACHPITAKWEGGWSDHKADPGGKTMYGITQAVYDASRKKWGLVRQSVRLITKTEALRIYKEQYWDPLPGRLELFPGVDLAVYDAGVNSGVSRARKWLSASVDLKDRHTETVKNVCRKRLSFVQSLKIWKTFGKGWGRRIADIEVKSVQMAMTAMAVKPSSQIVILNKEAEKAAASEKNAKTGAATSGGGAVASGGTAAAPETASHVPGVDPNVVTDPTAGWILTAVAVIAVIALIYFIVQARAQKARKESYQGVRV